jgi:glycosyltransferase involved in cell wall biosynthesis
LYLKTTDQRRDVVQGANVIVDSRLLNDDGMVALYAEADAFVFPSCGEGWGLPLLEAMATGLPCLTILNTGITAFANDSVCIPIRSERQPLLAMDELSAQESKDPELVQKNQALLVTVDVARVDDLVRKMEWVMRHWAEAKRIGLRAWRHAQGFSWLKAGRRLMAVLREIEQGEGIHATDRVEAH